MEEREEKEEEEIQRRVVHNCQKIRRKLVIEDKLTRLKRQKRDEKPKNARGVVGH